MRLEEESNVGTAGVGVIRRLAIVNRGEAAMRCIRAVKALRTLERSDLKVIARYGIEKESRCGYAVGLSYPPDWGERTMSLRGNDTTELQAGMTFHFMPALWLDDGGIEITEPIVITDSGAECLCTTPRKLFVK